MSDLKDSPITIDLKDSPIEESESESEEPIKPEPELEPIRKRFDFRQSWEFAGKMTSQGIFIYSAECINILLAFIANKGHSDISTFYANLPQKTVAWNNISPPNKSHKNLLILMKNHCPDQWLNRNIVNSDKICLKDYDGSIVACDFIYKTTISGIFENASARALIHCKQLIDDPSKIDLIQGNVEMQYWTDKYYKYGVIKLQEIDEQYKKFGYNKLMMIISLNGPDSPKKITDIFHLGLKYRNKHIIPFIHDIPKNQENKIRGRLVCRDFCNSANLYTVVDITDLAKQLAQTYGPDAREKINNSPDRIIMKTSLKVENSKNNSASCNRLICMDGPAIVMFMTYDLGVEYMAVL